MSAVAAHGSRRWLVLAVVSAGLLLVALDMSVLYTALPRLVTELGAGPSEKLWIINAYPLTVAGLLLGAGTLGDRIGHRPMLLAGLAIFGAGSLLAALAPSAAILIAGRALLGVGAAAMMPATLAIIRLAFEDERERGIAIAVWGMVSVAGAALGPIVGGVLLEYFWWGSVFMVNVPIVIVAFIAAVIVTPGGDGDPERPWDPVASIWVMAGLVGTVYAIKELAKPEPSWPELAAAVLVAVAGFVLFVRRQRGQEHPLIDLSVFRIPPVAAGVLGAVATMFTMGGVLLLVTQRLQLIDGYTPLQAGLLVLPLVLGTVPTATIGGSILYRVGPRPLIGGGLVLAGVGVVLTLVLTLIGPGWGAAGLVVIGAGLGFSMSAASATIVGSIPPRRAGMASSIDAVAYELGNLTGVAVLGSILTAVFAAQIALPAGAPVAAGESLDAAVAAASGGVAGLMAAATTAFDAGFTVVMLLAAGVLLVAGAVSAWWLRPGSGRDAGLDAGAEHAERVEGRDPAVRLDREPVA